GVDFVIATDNGSVDDTVAILRRYQERGRVRLLHEPADDYAQGEWVTRMARLAAVEHDADWIINSDADEFWWPEEGTLKQSLARVPPSDSAVAVARTNFVPVPG